MPVCNAEPESGQAHCDPQKRKGARLRDGRRVRRRNETVRHVRSVIVRANDLTRVIPAGQTLPKTGSI
jgi:hypothetical protein